MAVNEETVRLGSHFEEFDTIINSGSPAGRKLDFLIQEINREVNTIGSKASDIEIAKTVVTLKGEIEKLREQIINIGFGNMVNAERVVAVVSPESAPIKRIIREAEDKGNLINATYGRRTRAVIVTDSDHIVLSALQTETVSGRLSGDTGEESVKGDE